MNTMLSQLRTISTHCIASIDAASLPASHPGLWLGDPAARTQARQVILPSYSTLFIVCQRPTTIAQDPHYATFRCYKALWVDQRDFPVYLDRHELPGYFVCSTSTTPRMRTASCQLQRHAASN